MKNLKKQIQELKKELEKTENLHQNALEVLDDVMKNTRSSLELAKESIKATHAAIGDVTQIGSRANKVSEKIIKEFKDE